jgi:hypothetical protein
MPFVWKGGEAPRKERQRISFEIARDRMVANLRAELARFNQQGRDTRHIIRLSPSETVFIFYYGTREVIQAKVACGPRQTLEREAERLFTAVLKASSISSSGARTRSARHTLPQHARAAGTSAADFPEGPFRDF